MLKWIFLSSFSIPDSGFRIPDSGFRFQVSEFRFPDSDFRIPAFRVAPKTIRTANCLRLNVTVHQKFRNVAFHRPFKNASEKWSLCHWFLKNMDKPYDSPSKVGTVWSRHCICHGRLFAINIQYQHFFLVVQSPFDNWHSSFPPTTFFEIGVCLGVSKTQASKTQTSDPKNSDPLGVSKTQTLKTQTLWVSRKLWPY